MKIYEVARDLKNRFYNEVKIYMDYQKEEARLQNVKGILEAAYTLIDDDVETIKENIFAFENLLSDILPSVEVEIIIKKLEKIIYSPTYKREGYIEHEKVLEKLNNYKEEFHEKISELELKINKISRVQKSEEQNMITMRRTLSCFKFKLEITNNIVEYIKKYIKKEDLSNEYSLLIQEGISSHNKIVKGHRPNRSYVEKMLNINLFEYEMNFTEEQLKTYSQKLDGTIDSYMRELEKMLISDVSEEEFIDSFSIINENFDEEEISYFYKSFQNKLINNINSYKNKLLEDISMYEEEDLRNILIIEFNTLYRIFYQLNKKNEKYLGKEIIESKEENNEVEKSKYNIIFAMTGAGQISFLERDLKSFPKEYLETVKELLSSKIDGTIAFGKDETFTGNNNKLRDYSKLKDDQVRIMYRLIKGNIIFILGGFVKKQDHENDKYISISNRDYKIDLDKNEFIEKKLVEGQEVISSIYNYIDEEKRKKYR